MDVRSLGYLGVDVADLDAWRSYAEMLGTMVVANDDDGFAMKIDERPFESQFSAPTSPRVSRSRDGSCATPKQSSKSPTSSTPPVTP